MFLSSTDYPTGQIIEFNIEAAKESKNKEINAIYDKLIFQEDISFGKIFKREDNGDLWHIDPNQSIARFITKDQLALFHKWDSQSLLPNDQQFEMLRNIGGIPSSQYSFDPDNLQFPAKVVVNNGQEIDLCIFYFSEAPPFQRYFQKIILLNEITELKPSDLSLPHNLRLSSTLAEEIRMSFSPFTVKTKSGKLLTYNGRTQFVSNGEIKGSEIVSEVEFSYDRFDNKLKNVSFDDITFIIGKWDSRFEELFNLYRQQLKKKIKQSSTLPGSEGTWWQKLFRLE